MKFCIVEDDGRSYFMGIDQASKLLGISRRTFFQYLPQVHVKPEEKKRIGQKMYFAEEVVARMWVLQRRFKRLSNGGTRGVAQKPLPERGGSAGIAPKPRLENGGSEQRPPLPISQPQTLEQKQAMQTRIAEMLARF